MALLPSLPGGLDCKSATALEFRVEAKLGTDEDFSKLVEQECRIGVGLRSKKLGKLARAIYATKPRNS
jgi:hypothetical protein